MNPAQASPHEAGFVRRLLVALVRTVCRFPRTVLAVSFGLCALSLYAAFFHLQYLTQRNDLISPKKECQQRWRKYIEEFGDDDDVVVVVKGSDRGRMETALEALAAKISDKPALFDRLFYKADLRNLRNRALMYLPADDVRAIGKNLDDMGPLLGAPVEAPGGTRLSPWQGLTLFSLLSEADKRAAADKALSAGDVQFLTQLLAVVRSARTALDDPDRCGNPWGSLMARPAGQKDELAEPQYFFSGDGGLAFLLVRPVKDKGSFTAALQSVEAMRGIVAETRAAHPGVEIGLTGLPVLETDEMAAAQRDTQRASWLAVAGVALLFLIVYRSVSYPLLTIVTLLVGTAWALGWLTLTVGHLNILSATFAVMLIGMGDYGVLWVMRYEQARRQGADVRAALIHTTTHVAVGNLTAAMTLALAFFAAVLADFQAVAELGWIAGCGVLLCALACFTVLPALLMLFDRRKMVNAEALRLFSPSAAPIAADRTWLPFLSRRPGVVVACGLLVAAALAACACRISYDHNLLHLQAPELESVQWQRTLIEHTAGASWHALSIADSPEEALKLKARFEKLPEVSRVVEVATLAPPHQEEKLKLLADIHDRLSHLPPRHERIPHATPNSADLQGALDSLIEQVGAAKASPAEVAATDRKLLADLGDALRALRDGLPAEEPAANRAVVEGRLQRFEEDLAGHLAEDLHRLRDVSTPERITLADLPPVLRDRFVSRHGKWLLRVFGKEDAHCSLWDFGPLEHFTEAVRTVDAEATGKPFGTVEGLKAMKNGLLRAGGYAFLVITVVLLLDFRNLRHVLIALTPLVLGMVLALGVLGLFGVPLNPANMIAFPLILGVGVDNGVHVLHDYLIRRGEGRSNISHAIGRGVLVKALTSMLGFGTLMISSERGLQGLGFLLTLGVGCSMLSSLIFLPAVLQLMTPRTKTTIPTPHEVESPLARAA